MKINYHYLVPTSSDATELSESYLFYYEGVNQCEHISIEEP